MSFVGVVSIALLSFGVLATAQDSHRPCEDLSYENRNQIDYGPIVLKQVRGIAKDLDGVPVPNVCVGVFSELDHKLVAATHTDTKGTFELRAIPDGDYRIVARCEAFCPGNARIRIKSRSGSGKALSIHFRTSDIDTCSYIDQKQ
jgi:hypothetical protein